MGESKFRGKRIDNGEWVYGYYGKKIHPYSGDDQHYIMVPTYTAISNSSYFTDFEVDPATVGQCTGIRDRNGQDVFEKDIVKCDFQHIGYLNMLAEVTFHAGAFSLILDRGEYIPCLYEADRGTLEVIGNIHDS